LVLYVA